MITKPVPCIDCICLSVCKSLYDPSQHEGIFAGRFMTVLRKRCSLIDPYITNSTLPTGKGYIQNVYAILKMFIGETNE